MYENHNIVNGKWVKPHLYREDKRWCADFSYLDMKDNPEYEERVWQSGQWCIEQERREGIIDFAG